MLAAARILTARDAELNVQESENGQTAKDLALLARELDTTLIKQLLALVGPAIVFRMPYPGIMDS